MSIKTFVCCTCKVAKPATVENFFPVQIKRYEKRPNCTSLGKCSSCARKYSLEHSKKLKEKNLSRSRNEIRPQQGTLYIIAPIDIENYPYKIGISVGKDISKRLMCLQTAHWMNLKVYYKSPLLPDIMQIEKKIHNQYKEKRVRGEWFRIDSEDIELIGNELDAYENKLSEAEV